MRQVLRTHRFGPAHKSLEIACSMPKNPKIRLVGADEGYNKTPEGKWVCANGYNGTARNRCELGDNWASDCSAAAALTGCHAVVDCLAPTLTGLDLCTYDVSACTSAAPGEQCEVHCKSPFTGAKTEADERL